MLRILTGQIEQCLPDKAISKTLCPHIWIHYVMSGKGYYNGQLLQKGNAFIVYTGDYCEYYPAPDDPWKYIWIRIYGEDDEQLLEKCMFPKDSGIFYFSYFDKLEGICSYAFDNENKCELYLNENRLYAESLCKLILSLNTEESDIDIKESREKWVRRAKSYIRSNYHHTIKVEDIANGLSLITKTSPVIKGSAATIVIQGAPNTNYTIEFYKNNTEKASYDGLSNIFSDSLGFATWTFQIEEDCEPGDRKIIIKEKNSDKYIQTFITVQ